MQGNDYERKRQAIEDKIIDRIDYNRSQAIKTRVDRTPLLRVSILELITYKTAMTGQGVRIPKIWQS